jgi:hypothetical protein
MFILCKPDGTPFYVGKGTVRSKRRYQRICYHEYEANLDIFPEFNPYVNWLKINTIRKIWRGWRSLLLH